MSQPKAAPAPAASRRDPVRVVTAAALFDGHDAAINIMRRLLQNHGAEVIHLGHDRSVQDVLTAALQEDADAVAVSSYQGGHVEFFEYLVDELRAAGAGHVRVYGGGGGVIVPEEIERLHAHGVARIFSPEDGQRLGLDGMIRQILDECAEPFAIDPDAELARLRADEPVAVARLITWLERNGESGGREVDALRGRLAERRSSARAPVLGFTGPGGAGKSSLVDDLLRRFRREFGERSVGVLLVDPTRRRSGGALLGDRLRMNAIESPRVFARSLATRQRHLALSRAVRDAIGVLQAAGFDLVIVETAGIGQGDSEIVDLVDVASYVMTPEYGAPSQLEKIDMLELAELVALNKFDARGGEDALRDVTRQWKRSHGGVADAEVPVFPTIASRWDDPGTERLYHALLARVAARGFAGFPRRPVPKPVAYDRRPLIPAARAGYLGEIAAAVRAYRGSAEARAEAAAEAGALVRALEALGDPVPPAWQRCAPAALADGAAGADRLALRRRYDVALEAVGPELAAWLARWPDERQRYRGPAQSYTVREREIPVSNYTESLSGSQIPKVALPRADSPRELARYFALENAPGRFPFTAGVFPFKREAEEPTRMFAGEGTPEATNRRFHLLAQGMPAVRLSTAFDSVTLYGRDPDPRPDVWGKVGTSGVSACSVDDAKKLYSGFDLVAPNTSVSMTINGPAPVVLAFFLNAAIDQSVERHLRETGRLDGVRARFRELPRYAGALPAGHDGLGLGLLGIAGDEAVDAETYARIRADVLARVRGTVQADILKEDQAQNTCIFSTEFALELMGDVQEYFTRHGVQNFYSVSISGYHIAEAGANPLSQLAFTLANGFTYAEYYLARGMAIDDFAPNFSFFFSNGLDPEYAVIGRVARRIWAVAMRERYGASERSQKLKYHVQTSGRSLHAQEMAFNDIRTTAQALLGLADHCNSLHTNAYDEAVTTPTEESVRRALAIQLILNREFGLLRNENPLQGSHLIEELTDLVEEAVLREFERLSERGGVFGAMERMYQRGRIQDESLHYEAKKHSGELPIIGVNTFRNPSAQPGSQAIALRRASDAEKRAQLESLRAFQARHAARAPEALRRLQQVAQRGGNAFAELLETVKVASLGQIADALFAVGGQYRRAM